MAKQSFSRRIRELEHLVGDGHLTGTFLVNGGGRTIPLEVGYWRNHMGRNGRVVINNWSGGENPHAIQNSFEESYEISLEDIAKTTLEHGPQEAMVRHVDRVDDLFKQKAPEVTGSYKNSSAHVVTDGGIPIHEYYGQYYLQEPSV